MYCIGFAVSERKLCVLLANGGTIGLPSNSACQSGVGEKLCAVNSPMSVNEKVEGRRMRRREVWGSAAATCQHSP